MQTMPTASIKTAPSKRPHPNPPIPTPNTKLPAPILKPANRPAYDAVHRRLRQFERNLPAYATTLVQLKQKALNGDPEAREAVRDGEARFAQLPREMQEVFGKEVERSQSELIDRAAGKGRHHHGHGHCSHGRGHGKDDRSGSGRANHHGAGPQHNKHNRVEKGRGRGEHVSVQYEEGKGGKGVYKVEVQDGSGKKKTFQLPGHWSQDEVAQFIKGQSG